MTYEEIRKYASDNSESKLSSDELDHVAMCLEHIQKWYYEDYPLGDFLTAVVNNDLLKSVFLTDDINIKTLKIYTYFLTWNILADWRKKAKRVSK